MTATSRPIIACQSCRSDALKSVLFLGLVPPVNTMVPVGQVAEEQSAYPLELMRCEACTLVQIGLEVDPEVLFPHSYPYLSGSTRILRDNFADLFRRTKEVLGLAEGDLVVDIGSNDGTLLSNFMAGGCQVLGIEPSQAGDLANQRGIRTVTDYFGLESARRLSAQYGKARLVTAANVFAHIGDVHQVIDGILEFLAPDGAFVSENHYLGGLIETVQYDTVYHEHLRYYHLGAMVPMLGAHGLEIFHVERIPTHGGSIRVYSARKGSRPVQPSVAEMLQEEIRTGVADGSRLTAFSKAVLQSKLDLHALIAPLKRAGARIYGIGAPSRASTLINYVGLDDQILDAVMEVSTSNKLNKYIPGTRIPVLDEAMLYRDQPDYALFLSWHIADELAVNLKRNGYKGRFIVPLPEPRII